MNLQQCSIRKDFELKNLQKVYHLGDNFEILEDAKKGPNP